MAIGGTFAASVGVEKAYVAWVVAVRDSYSSLDTSSAPVVVGVGLMAAPYLIGHWPVSSC